MSGSTVPERPLLVQLRWPIFLLFLAGLAFFAYRDTLNRVGSSAQAVGDLASGAATRAGQIAEKFFTADVTERFVSSMPEVRKSGVFEVATLGITESLSRSDERRMLWDALSLGTTTVEIEVPVTYRYHVRLDDTWQVEVHGPVCLVRAPAIRPSQPPSIHTDGMRSRTLESWLRFDGAERMTELERSLTPRLVERAKSAKYRDLVREEARRGVAEFVRTWLLQQDFWNEDEFATVKVVFPDEIKEPSADAVTVQSADG